MTPATMAAVPMARRTVKVSFRNQVPSKAANSTEVSRMAATVAALRETSVLFAALLGSWLLKEAFTVRRAVGTAAIVAGVMALRLG